MVDIDTDIRAAFLAAFDNLPSVQREVFRLHRVENLSYTEIAWLLRTDERFLERQLAKAIVKLGRQLDGYPLRWWERWF